MGRQQRAILAIGGVWALAWLSIGALVALYAAGSPPQPEDLLHRPVEVPTFLLVWTGWGGLSGAGFAIILRIAERRRTLGALSTLRMALWGALGAMSAPAILTAIDLARGTAGSPLYSWRIPLVSLFASAVLGGACAAATLIAARRGVSEK